MTITITKNQLVCFIVFIAFVASIKLAYECGKDDGARTARTEQKQEAQAFSERREDSTYQKRVQLVKSYAVYRTAQKDLTYDIRNQIVR